MAVGLACCRVSKLVGDLSLNVFISINNNTCRSTMLQVIAIAGLLLLSSCATTDNYRLLSSEQKSDWDVCRVPVADMQCPIQKTFNQSQQSSAEIGRSFCIARIQEEYASASDTKQWLVRHGCPRDMVE
jgi:hypothetical protein